MTHLRQSDNTMDNTCQIKISDFTHSILDMTVYFKVIELDQSLFVWVGKDRNLSNMAVAMPAVDVSRSEDKIGSINITVNNLKRHFLSRCN